MADPRPRADEQPLPPARRGTAEELLAAGLEAVGHWRDDLRDLRKTDPRKQAVAWLIRQDATVSNRWVSQRLWMGHDVNVSQAVRRTQQATSGELARYKRAVAGTPKPKD